MRGKKVKKREVVPDHVYNSPLVAKMINRLMKSGKKTVAQKIVYATLDLLKKEGDPVEVFEKAVLNVGPKLEVHARRVGGASYQIPAEVRGERRVSLAIRWIVAAAAARSNKEYHSFQEKLAAEVKDALNNLGGAVKKRDTVLRMAEANRAFAHFRW